MSDYSVMKGLVIRESKYGENDRIISAVTAEKGRITIFARGAMRTSSKRSTAMGPYMYSEFVLKKGSEFYTVTDASPIESFFGVSDDLRSMALASYISEVLYWLCQEEVPDENNLRLALNTFYALAHKKKTPRLIKAAFEFRAASNAGFLPDLSGCSRCGRDTAEEWLMRIVDGEIICGECNKDGADAPSVKNEFGDIIETATPIAVFGQNVLDAMRIACFAPIQKFMSFDLDGENLSVFSDAAEKYLLWHFESEFKTLDFYKRIDTGQ
ncbi:MAG: DNA repair protein RecO [Clostridia bacterium]|nr:DNA repair protein RecO [Clostridia bacterium]